MGNGWHEWPLVLFTVLGQCVVGATIVSGLAGWPLRVTRPSLSAASTVRFSVAGDGHRLSRLGNTPRFTAARV